MISLRSRILIEGRGRDGRREGRGRGNRRAEISKSIYSLLKDLWEEAQMTTRGQGDGMVGTS